MHKNRNSLKRKLLNILQLSLDTIPFSILKIKSESRLPPPPSQTVNKRGKRGGKEIKKYNQTFTSQWFSIKGEGQP
jgi:hypothetical protein